MAKVTATIRTSQVKKDGKVNIKIRIFHNRDTRYIGTRFNVPVNQFSVEDGRVKRSHELSSFINKELKLLEARYETRILEMPDLDRIGVTQLIARLCKKQSLANIYELFDKKITRLNEHEKYKTATTYQNTRRNIEKMTGRSIVMMKEVDEIFLNDFLNWHLKLGNSVNTAAVDFRNIRSVYNNAIDDRIVPADDYPFRRFKIPVKKTRKRNLGAKQINKIYTADLTGKNAQARDIFMLSFFLIGINMKDLFLLTPDNIVGDRLVYERSKTQKEYSIFIQPEAQEIIERHSDPDGVRLLNFYKQYSTPYDFYKQTNKFLYRFTPLLKIKDKVTTYYARHSWATIAFNSGIEKDVVQKALGHGSYSVTDIYIDFDLRRVDEANRAVIDLVV